MSEVSLSVEQRVDTGKGVARKLREAGRVPGVVYGGGHDPVSVTLDPKVLERIIETNHAGINALIDLEGASGLGGRTVMVKELQREAVKGYVLHADLFEVNLQERVHVSVPVHLEGEPIGVKLGGGLLDHELHHVEISCLPSNIPDQLVVDVSELVRLLAWQLGHVHLWYCRRFLWNDVLTCVGVEYLCHVAPSLLFFNKNCRITA